MHDGDVSNKRKQMKEFNKQSDDPTIIKRVLSVHFRAVFNLSAANPRRKMTLF